MPINYHIQELPDLHDGEKKIFPKAEVYTSFDNKKMINRIALEAGIQKGAVLAVMDALPKALKSILLEGHTCKIDGLGTFSVSLAFDKEESVCINKMNLKVDQELMTELREEATFCKVQQDVVSVASTKGQHETRKSFLEEWFQTHDSITLTEYAQQNGISSATASREMKRLCNDPGACVKSVGTHSRKIWVKK